MNYDVDSIKKRMSFSKVLRKVIKELLYIALIIFLYNVFLITLSTLNGKNAKEFFGYQAYIISTDSMSPTIEANDVIIVQNQKENTLKRGDIIAFYEENEVITHRITDIKKENEENIYITKGDKNKIDDENKVIYKDIEGVVILTIPKIGKVILLLRNKIYIIIIILLIIIVVFNIRKRKEKSDSRREKKKIEDRKNENSSDN